MPKYYEDEAIAEAFSEMTNYSTLWARAVLSTLKEDDVAPVIHAHWIYKYQDCEGRYVYECSSCKRFERVEFKDDLKTMPYCHCGARMDEEQEK